MNEYWKESLEDVFDTHGITPKEQLLEDIVHIAEMESEACGYHLIPNPMSTEVEELKAKIIEIKSEHDRQINGVLKGVAERRNVDIGSVTIDKDGLVIYYP